MEEYKYIKWLRFDHTELYDLMRDPYEQVNLINDENYSATVDKMQQELQDLQLEALGLK